MISNPNTLIIVAYPLCFFVTFASQRLGFNGNGVGRGLFALRLSQFETKSAAIFLSSLRVVDHSEDYCQKKKQLNIALPPEEQ